MSEKRITVVYRIPEGADESRFAMQLERARAWMAGDFPDALPSSVEVLGDVDRDRAEKFAGLMAIKKWAEHAQDLYIEMRDALREAHVYDRRDIRYCQAESCQWHEFDVRSRVLDQRRAAIKDKTATSKENEWFKARAECAFGPGAKAAETCLRFWQIHTVPGVGVKVGSLTSDEAARIKAAAEKISAEARAAAGAGERVFGMPENPAATGPWVSMAQREPADGNRVIVWRDGFGWPVVGEIQGRRVVPANGSAKMGFDSVKWWAPIVYPPKAQEAKAGANYEIPPLGALRWETEVLRAFEIPEASVLRSLRPSLHLDAVSKLIKFLAENRGIEVEIARDVIPTSGPFDAVETFAKGPTVKVRTRGSSAAYGGLTGYSEGPADRLATVIVHALYELAQAKERKAKRKASKEAKRAQAERE